MNLHQSICQLLKDIGPGQMTSTAYDTAWIARLDSMNESLSGQAMDWLRAHQLPDGSWGAKAPLYRHDRIICTLSAATALAERGHSQDRRRCERAQMAMGNMMKDLFTDPAGATIGFEMIVPTLLSEAQKLGILRRQDDEVLKLLTHQRAVKLAALPEGTINRSVTVAFSIEMAGLDKFHLLDIENLQEINGSVALSPSATAYFVLHLCPQNVTALKYLSTVGAREGVPNVAPFDVFEPAWTLWNLALAGPLDDEIVSLCKPHLDFLETNWEAGKGIAHASVYTPKDGDDTGLVYEVLTHFDRRADLEAVQSYEENDHYRCFALEANPSISTNIHVLGALRQAGLERRHPSVHKILTFLRRTQSMQLFWFDKWHASPYYPTAHAIIASAGYNDDMLENAVYWLLETQNANGAWGYYLSSAEETAYCLQALTIWKRHGGQVPTDALKRGAAWLADHIELPYPPLWIGKCLYCPVLVVRSAILSALELVAQECGQW
jgi:halimadienyl-diphosphate synthase